VKWWIECGGRSDVLSSDILIRADPEVLKYTEKPEPEPEQSAT